MPLIWGVINIDHVPPAGGFCFKGPGFTFFDAEDYGDVDDHDDIADFYLEVGRLVEQTL